MSVKMKKKKKAHYSPRDSLMMTVNNNDYDRTRHKPYKFISSVRNNVLRSPTNQLQQDFNQPSKTSRNSARNQHGHGTYRSTFDPEDHLASIDQQIQQAEEQEAMVEAARLTSRRQTNDTGVAGELGPQDVYICNCCWISKELEPAYRHLSSLSSLFFLFNFLVFAFGFACLGMGLWLRIDPKIYEIHKYIETQNFTYAGWIILFGGFGSCLISLMGFVGTGKQSQCLLLLYMVILLFLLIGFIGSLVLLIVHGLGIKLELFLNKEIYEQMRRRAMSNQNEWAAQFLDFIQVKMRCCGAVDFTDYAKLGLVVPTTCYTIEKNYINAPGCGRAIRDLLDVRAGLAVGFLAGSIVSQLLCFILAMTISCSIYQWRTNPQRSPTDNPRSVTPSISYSAPVTFPTMGDLPNQSNRWINRDEISPKRHRNDALLSPRSRTPIIM